MDRVELDVDSWRRSEPILALLGSNWCAVVLKEFLQPDRHSTINWMSLKRPPECADPRKNAISDVKGDLRRWIVALVRAIKVAEDVDDQHICEHGRSLVHCRRRTHRLFQGRP